MKFSWLKAGRKVGELKIGDSLWDLEGKVYLVANNEKVDSKIISIETAQKWLKEGKFKQISVDEDIYEL